MFYGPIIDKLLDGNVNFFKYLSGKEAKNVIEYVSCTKSRNEIVEKCFDRLAEEYPAYAFLLVYNMEEYEEFCTEYLNNNIGVLLQEDFFHIFIGSAKWASKYVYEHLNILVMANSELIFIIIKHCICSGDRAMLEKLLYSSNFTTRGIAMYELIDSYPSLFFKFYENVIDYMASRNEKGEIVAIIPMEQACRIAFSVIDKGLDVEKFDEIKEFIFNNYDRNILASLLGGRHTELGVEPVEYWDVIERDMTRYFLTSKDFKYELYKRGKNIIDREIYDEFDAKIDPFIKIDEEIVEHIFSVGLGDKFLESVDRYLEISTGSKEIRNLACGSCTRTIKIGDYVIKCSDNKWDVSEEPPQMFLFAKEYVVEYARDGLGIITGAIEVQKHFSRAVDVSEKELIDNFFKTAREYGYEIDDSVMGFQNTPNLFHLDNYTEALNYEQYDLPEWFKKEPVVWVDIDLIHKLKR